MTKWQLGTKIALYAKVNAERNTMQKTLDNGRRTNSEFI